MLNLLLGSDTVRLSRNAGLVADTGTATRDPIPNFRSGGQLKHTYIVTPHIRFAMPQISFCVRTDVSIHGPDLRAVRVPSLKRVVFTTPIYT
jgi:hypothetical protein